MCTEMKRLCAVYDLHGRVPLENDKGEGTKADMNVKAVDNVVMIVVVDGATVQRHTKAQRTNPCIVNKNPI